MYEHLAKIYYKNQSLHETEYEKRINSYGTIRLPFNIKPHKSNKELSCFYVNHPELDYLHDQIIKQSKLIRNIMLSENIPGIAIKQYIRAKLIDELMSTNGIEGVRSTKAEMETVLDIIVRKESSVKKKVRHHSLMKSYFSLLNEEYSTINSIEQVREVYDNLVLEEIKKDEHLDGALFRSQPVDVVTETGRVIHKGVFPESSINSHLINMINYLNHDNSPALYKVAIAHYYFGYIHPFYDGNGRTSRFISSMYLKEELDILTSLSLSYSTYKSQDNYYDAFLVCNNPLNMGELTYFCEVFFEIIYRAQSNILEELSQKQAKMEQLELLIQSLNFKDKNCMNILYILGQNYIFGIEGKGLTKNELISATSKTAYLVRNALENLLQEGYIEYLSRRPIESTLSEKLRVLLDN